MSGRTFFTISLVLALCLATPTSASLTEDDMKELIQAHNFYRAKAQPTPTDMVALVRRGWVGGGRRGEG